MILLYTNVLSETMRPNPDKGVIKWIDSLPDDDVWNIKDFSGIEELKLVNPWEADSV
jgi:hypothetical protein